MDDETDWTPILVLTHLTELAESNYKRYEERFFAQEKAVHDALIAQEKAVNAALAASEKAITVSEVNLEKWRANANEWRAAMDDRETRFSSKAEADLKFTAANDRITKLEEAIKLIEGKSKGISVSWSVFLSITGLILTIMTIAGIVVSLLK